MFGYFYPLHLHTLSLGLLDFYLRTCFLLLASYLSSVLLYTFCGRFGSLHAFTGVNLFTLPTSYIFLLTFLLNFAFILSECCLLIIDFKFPAR